MVKQVKRPTAGKPDKQKKNANIQSLVLQNWNKISLKTF